MESRHPISDHPSWDGLFFLWVLNMEIITFATAMHENFNKLEVFQHFILEKRYLRILKEECNTLNIYKYSGLFDDFYKRKIYGLNPDIRKHINTLGER